MRIELIPNIPCPHCEKQNTTHRLVRKEDGFTKVSRRCTSCGNEWTHTWDRDWLADAKLKKLQAENARLRTDRRERIATAILAGLVALPNIQDSAATYVQTALAISDALIAELDKEDKP